MARRSRPSKRPASHPPEIQEFIDWQSKQYARGRLHGNASLPLALFGVMSPRMQLTVAALLTVLMLAALLVALVEILSLDPPMTMIVATVVGAIAAGLVIAMIVQGGRVGESDL